MRVVARVRSDAPRLSDAPTLSVTIFNDQATHSDNRSAHSPSSERRNSSSEHHKRSADGRDSSSEQHKSKRSSAEVDRHHIRSREMSEPSPGKISKTADVRRLPKNLKKFVSVTVEKDRAESSDDSSSVVAVQKRLSRAKTVRMYRTVKVHSDPTDDADCNDDDDSGDGTSKKRKRTTANDVSKNKSSSNRERKHSSKRSPASEKSRERKAAASSMSNGSNRSSERKYRSSGREEKHKSAKTAQRGKVTE